MSRWHRVLPWLSLAVGLGGAIVMDRGPQRAPWVAGAALLLWGTLMVRLRLMQRPLQPGRKLGEALWKVVRASALVATQSLIQLALFFSLPFYLRAATWDAGHVVFCGALLALASIALWDPWTEQLLHRPVTSLFFPAVASFLGLNAVLPGLGLSNHVALWLAAALAGLGIPVAMLGAAQDPAALGTRVRAAASALVLPAFLAAGGARVIPAAPMRLVEMDFGTRVAGHWVADPIEHLDHSPRRLVCATAIYAPLGLKEQLVHVWRRDGEPRHRIELSIRGGRTDGFRTRSWLTSPADESDWECRVETSSGQLLGRRSIHID